jgi:predicted nucleotidyltransferase
MMRMRDVIAEGEGDACNDTLWRVVRDELPRLAGELSPLVAAMEGRAREMPVATVKGRVLEQRLGVSREDVTELCRKHHIRRLAFFGSVLRDDFGDDSDVDVLVEFAPAHVPGLMGIVRMEDELSAMMGRKVDLRTPGDLNRRFRAEVIAAAEVWYDVA